MSPWRCCCCRHCYYYTHLSPAFFNQMIIRNKIHREKRKGKRLLYNWLCGKRKEMKKQNIDSERQIWLAVFHSPHLLIMIAVDKGPVSLPPQQLGRSGRSLIILLNTHEHRRGWGTFSITFTEAINREKRVKSLNQSVLYFITLRGKKAQSTANFLW